MVTKGNCEAPYEDREVGLTGGYSEGRPAGVPGAGAAPARMEDEGAKQALSCQARGLLLRALCAFPPFGHLESRWLSGLMPGITYLY